MKSENKYAREGAFPEKRLRLTGQLTLGSISRAAWFERLREHVNTCDFPERAEGWLELGRKAGFTRAHQIFTDPLNLYRMFRFEP